MNTVPPGNVGVLVNLYGTDKGVQAKEVGTGRYWLSMNENLYLFPTFTQTYTWTDANKEEIQFQSKENLPILADVGITYHVNPDKVALLFQKYRKGIDEITNVFLHNMVRDAFVEQASRLPIETIYGDGKVALITSVQKEVQDQVSDIGLVVEKIYLVGKFKLPDQINSAINNKMAAAQKAEQSQIELVQSTAEAAKAVAKATGEANSKLIVAEADAKAIRLKADALKDSPMLVQWEAVGRWNGQLPTVTGGAMPFINVK